MIEAILPRLPRLVICLPILAAALGVGELFARATTRVIWKHQINLALQYEAEWDCDEEAKARYARIQRHAPRRVAVGSKPTCEDYITQPEQPVAPAPSPAAVVPAADFEAPALRAEDLTGGGGQGFPADTVLHLLYTNNIRGQLHSRGGHSGLARLAYVVNQERTRGGRTLLFDSGNLLSANRSFTDETLLTRRYESRTMLEAMAHIAPDAMVPNQGDLALGVDWLSQQATELNLPYVCANLTTEDGELVFTPWRAIGVGDQMVGVFGVMQEVKRPPGYALTDPMLAATEAVRTLHQLGCDLVIGLSNLGWVEDLELVQTIPGVDFLLGVGKSTHRVRAAASGPTPTQILWPPAGGYHVGRSRILFVEQGRGFYPEQVVAQAIQRRENLTDPALLRAGTQAPADTPVGYQQRQEQERAEREWAEFGAAELIPEGRHLLTVDVIELDRTIMQDPELRALLDPETVLTP